MESQDRDRSPSLRLLSVADGDDAMSGSAVSASPPPRADLFWPLRVWSWIAPRPENAPRLTAITAFLYGALPTVGGSAVTVLSILGASWSLLYLLIVRPRIRFSRAQKWLVGIYLFFALTTLVSGLVRKDPWPGFVRAVNDWPFLYALLSLSVLASLGPIDCRRPLARGAAIGSIAGFFVGAIQYLFLIVDNFRPAGGTGNSALYGQAAFVLAFLSMMCFSRETPAWRRVSLAGLACGLGAVGLSGSRASAVTAGVLMLVLGWSLVRNREFVVLRRAALAGLLLLVLGAATFPQWKTSPLARRFSNLVTRLDQVDDAEVIAESVDQRIIQIRAAWKALWRRPWLGYGMQHRMKAIAKLEPPAYRQVFRYTHIHFLYLDYAVGNGVIGFVSLILLLGAPVIMAWMPGDPLRSERLYGGCILTVGFSVLGLAGACLGMDIGNTIYACIGTLLVVPATSAAAASQATPADKREAEPASVRRAA